MELLLYLIRPTLLREHMDLIIETPINYTKYALPIKMISPLVLCEFQLFSYNHECCPDNYFQWVVHSYN